MSPRRKKTKPQLDLAGIGAKPAKLAYTPKELAEVCGVGLPTAYDIARKIGARVGKNGGRWLVSREALEKHLRGAS